MAIKSFLFFVRHFNMLNILSNYNLSVNFIKHFK